MGGQRSDRQFPCQPQPFPPLGPATSPVADSIACAVAVVVLLLVAARPAKAAQEGVGATSDVLRVFLDCDSRFCDFDRLRREIVFVNWMRDRVDADVHVLVTTERTGGGGTEFGLEFLGRGAFAGLDQRLVYRSTQVQTDEEIRRGLTQMIRLGLVRYAAETAVAADLTVGYERPEGGEAGPAAATAEDDPWNFWVFRSSARGFFTGERSRTSFNVSGSFNANRTTEAWKINVRTNGRYSQSTFTFRDGSEFVNTTSNYGVDGLVVKSVGERWAVGGRASLSHSTFLNQDLAVRVAPAIEYNFFPYDESSRRLFTLRYEVGGSYTDYEEVTIFDKLSETLADESLTATVAYRQPWGDLSTSVEVSHFFQDFSKYRAVVFGSLDVRLFKGFTLDLGGSASLIRDQIFLPAAGATDEEVLVQRRQLETSFQYFFSVGVSYTFGSIYNNVVNPRFGGGSRFTFFF